MGGTKFAEEIRQNYAATIYQFSNNCFKSFSRRHASYRTRDLYSSFSRSTMRKIVAREMVHGDVNYRNSIVENVASFCTQLIVIERNRWVIMPLIHSSSWLSRNSQFQRGKYCCIERRTIFAREIAFMVLIASYEPWILHERIENNVRKRFTLFHAFFFRSYIFFPCFYF